MAKKPLEIDCIAGSQLRDTQGEMLSVEGADISELEAGKGRWNDNHGKGFFNSIGRITKAKKIFKEEDCDDDRQRHYWNKVKVPYIYAKGYLYDDEDHPNARAAAAILRNIHKSDTPLQLKASVEGGVIARGIKDPSLLARTKIHSVAITFTPANNNTLVEPTSLEKSAANWETDLQLMKSVLHLAETNVPSFRHIARDASATRVNENLQQIANILNSDMFVPSKEQVLTHSLEQKVLDNVTKIHEIVLDKSIGNKIAGAALGLASMASPTVGAEPKPAHAISQPAKTPSHQDVFEQTAKQYPMLGAIGCKESSCGTNMKHATIKDRHSPHYGHTAGGTWGMMPNQAAFILKKDPALAKKYPKLVEAAANIGANHEQFTNTFNTDPRAAADFAISAYKRNQSKTHSPEMLAYSWLNGLQGSLNKFKEGGAASINKHPYVKDVMKEYTKRMQANKPGPSRAPASKVESNKPLNKAMTAGYGGAGAPTNLTYGGVIQSESVEQGRPRMRYVVCPACGKEQVHAKYQVKCREPECNQSFPLETLYKLLS